MANGNFIEKLRSLLLLTRELAGRHPHAEISRIADELESLICYWEASAGLGSTGSPPDSTKLAEFIARENIRRFKAQLLAAAAGTRETTIRSLLDDEERHLRDLLAGKE